MAEQQKNNSEVFALRPTPLNERKSMLDMVWVQAGCVICIPAFMLGGLVAAQMPTWTGVAACGVGYLLTLILMIVLGIQGADLGIPTCAVQSEKSHQGNRKQGTDQKSGSVFPKG